jgi:hypothetical protein
MAGVFNYNDEGLFVEDGMFLLAFGVIKEGVWASL